MILDDAHINRNARSGHGFHHNFIVHSFKQHAFHLSGHLTVLHIYNVNILRTDNHINRFILVESEIHTVKCDVVKAHFVILGHGAREDVTLAYKVRHETVRRLIVNILRRSHLLDLSILHDNDLVRHGERLFLIVSDKNKGDSYFLLDPFQLVLHLFAQL